MPLDLKKLLRGALDEIERDEAHDKLDARFKALEEKKPEFRLSDLLTMLNNASDEELDALEGTMFDSLVREYRSAEHDDGNDGGDGDDDDKGKKKLKPKQPEKKTRPGRKSGQAYNWWVDDDGKVFKLDVARVFSGEDEDDEVELPDD